MVYVGQCQIYGTLQVFRMIYSAVFGGADAVVNTWNVLWRNQDIFIELKLVIFWNIKMDFFCVNWTLLCSALVWTYRALVLQNQDFMWESFLWAAEERHFLPGCSSVAEQTRVCYLAAQRDPFYMFLASLIYMELQQAISQCQFSGTAPQSHDMLLNNLSAGYRTEKNSLQIKNKMSASTTCQVCKRGKFTTKKIDVLS